MIIEKLLDLLPIDLINDIYFQNLKDIIIKHQADLKIISKIEVSEDIYYRLNNNNLFTISNTNILNLKYILKDSIYSLGIKYDNNNLYIYFESKSFNKQKRTILIKNISGSIIETKEVIKENGLYKSYNSNIYYYDSDYNKIDVNISHFLDTMFSEEFGIPLELSHVMRNNFPKYAKVLNVLASEQVMKNRDKALSLQDFYYFRTPWLVSNIEECLNEEYNHERTLIVKKYLDINSESKSLSNLESIKNIIDWIKTTLNYSSEFVISNSIYQNLIPLLTGEYKCGYNTKGFIIEKNDNDFYLYNVHFTTKEIIYSKILISKEEAIGIYYSNSLNDTVPNLDIFFCVNKKRRN